LLVELRQAGMAMRDKRAHAQLFCQRDGLAVLFFRAFPFRRLA
jgi:hypothetical protein